MNTAAKESTRSISGVTFGRGVCGNIAEAECREWLVTNALGGFSSGTIAGTLTRRYHGLLVAALKPPLQRTLLAAKLDETVTYRATSYELAANRWRDNYLSPRGFELIERFELDGSTPVWRYACADALLEKRIWMEQGANVTHVRYTALRAAFPITLQLRALVNYRDFHGNTHAGDWQMLVRPCEDGLCVEAFEGAQPLYVTADRAGCEIENVWYRDFILAEETRRGLDDRDDHLCAGRFAATLAEGQSLTVSARAGAAESATTRTEAAGGEPGDGAAENDAVLARLTRAAEQFIVARPTENDPEGLTIIAGYHWFGDWGRDTMISLPGLTLVTGRAQVAGRILRSFAQYVEGGMLPNFFPEAGEAPEYNTVDGALWYLEAAGAYVDASGDLQTLRALWPSLNDVIASYRKGTRYNIHMDADGLIVAGAPGVALTWMDAKIGDWVVTPRMGKPVEIAALWYNALARMTAMAQRLGRSSTEYSQLAELVRDGFARFWNHDAGYCYDVLDGPGGDDGSLRPNQIFAVSLPHSPLDSARQRSVVDVCAAQLVTSHGLRTLAQSEARFVATYGGSPRDRDAAYHQGTVWPWLLGPFAIAHARAYGNKARAKSFLEPLVGQLFDRGLGTLSELADGAAPFRPNGAIAQAWSVAETLRAWKYLSDEE